MISTRKCIGTCGYLGGLPAVLEPFCWAWGQMREFNTEFLCGPGEQVHYTRATFSLHANARNFLATELRGEWLWMTDADHVFEPDIVYKMVTVMQKYKTPVLSGIYRHKAKPHHVMLWHYSEDVDGFAPIAEIDHSVPVFRVDAAGGGCLLIHRSVFTRLLKRFPDEGPFDHRGRYGEDLSFFLKCREAGIPCYATPLVETIHLVTRGIDDSMYVPGWFRTEEVALAVPGVA